MCVGESVREGGGVFGTESVGHGLVKGRRGRGAPVLTGT